MVNQHDAERKMSMMGVPGRLLSRMTGNPGWRSDVWVSQKWISEGRPVRGYGANAQLWVEVRLDDNCKNGHSTFAITGEISTPNRRNNGRDILAGGCVHEDIARVFPELAPLIRWHLTSTDGPLHYIANAAYHASDRDHNGRAAGEPSRFAEMLQFGTLPLAVPVPRGLGAFLREVATYDREGMEAALIPVAVAAPDDPKYSTKFAPQYQFAGQPVQSWGSCSFGTEEEAQRFAASFIDHSPCFFRIATAWSEGKARDLDAARSAAVWPDATDAELSVPRAELEAALKARHPRLMEQFRTDMEAAGLFLFPADYVAPRDLEA